MTVRTKRLTEDGLDRLSFAMERLVGAYRLAAFAEAAGVKSDIAPEAVRSLERDVERARQGKPIPAFDAFGGRAIWKLRKEAKA